MGGLPPDQDFSQKTATLFGRDSDTLSVRPDAVEASAPPNVPQSDAEKRPNSDAGSALPAVPARRPPLVPERSDFLDGDSPADDVPAVVEG
jgi:hypothetical protein